VENASAFFDLLHPGRMKQREFFKKKFFLTGYIRPEKGEDPQEKYFFKILFF